MGLNYIICENCFTKVYPTQQKDVQFFSCPGCGVERTMGKENFFGERNVNILKLPNMLDT